MIENGGFFDSADGCGAIAIEVAAVPARAAASVRLWSIDSG